MSDEDHFRKLITQRGVYKGQLTRFETFLNSVQSNDEQFQINERLEKCHSLWDAFDAVQTEIEILDDSPEHLEERVAYENKHYKTVALAKKLLNRSTNSQQVSQSISNNNNQNLHDDFINVKLPAIELPTFSGEKYSDWLPFFETFQVLIGNHSKLSKLQKFHYLNCSLKGEAKEVVQSLEITEANYESAITLLQERYQNNRLIINNHVKNIVNLTPMIKESHFALRKFIDGIQRDLKALISLNEPVNNWDTLLIFIISAKLDTVTRREWEIHSLKDDLTTFNDFIKFIKNKCQILETMQANKDDLKGPSSSYNNKTKYSSHILLATAKQCAFCNENHKFFQCKTFLNLAPPQRLNEVRRLRLCVNCLQATHGVEDCSWSSRCKQCGRTHNTLLHLSSRNGSNQNTNKTISQSQTQIQSNSQSHSTNPTTSQQTTTHVTHEPRSHTTQSATHFAHSQETSIHQSSMSNDNPVECNRSAVTTYSVNKTRPLACLLATAYVTIFDKQNEPHLVRALLDPGSMTNFITNDLCNRLKLPKQNTNLSILGVSSVKSSSTKWVQATIKSLQNEFQVGLDFYILDKITGQLPTSYIDPDKFIVPEGIILADKTFHLPGEIHLLLSADIYYELLCENKIKMGPNAPFLVETKLGWIISGKYDDSVSGNLSVSNQSTHCKLSVISNTELSEQLEKFWNLEHPTVTKKYTDEEQQCEDLFCSTTRQDKKGNFIVQLPIKENDLELGDNKQIALKRFYTLERKLQANPNVRKLYTEFMDTYQELGHMSPIADDEIHSSNATYYLPHHPVIKETSTTCKLRVVFDASCKTVTGVSLNDKLKVGPIIQADLFSILVRFRKHNVVLCADVAKMYRMVWIDEAQRDLQRIVWRATSNQEIQHFRLNTVTYGTASASFLAIRSLHEAAKNFESIYPSSSKSILEDFYVDDYLSGSETCEGALQLKEEVSEILSHSGFTLRKWVSNKRSIFKDCNQQTDIIEHYITEDHQTKTLGILWQVDDDVLKYSVVLASGIKPTKRHILSIISKIFDPLGLIGPIIVRAKMILQKLWTEKISWDDIVSSDLQAAWNEFYTELSSVSQLHIPRHVLLCQPISIELCGYCDASEQAYGACIYVRSTNNRSDISTKLLCAKSKIAPLKTISLPRLELCGALLLAQLMNKVTESFHAQVDGIYYFTDSVIVLSWLVSEPARLKTFVGNRVAEIQSLTEVAKWSHVSSQENPADIISRGYSPAKLMDSALWWQGPGWLQESKSNWPEAVDLVEPLETRTPKSHTFLTFYELQIVNKYSSLHKLRRIMAYCFRFIANLKSNDSKLTGCLTVSEIDHAFEFLIKQAQLQDFPEEIQHLKHNKPVHKSSKLVPLNPFLDLNGVLRLGGRIGNSDAQYDTKFPIILSGNHSLTKLIIRHEHLRNLHAGTQALLATIRLKFWPIAGRSAVKKVLRKCIVCFRNKPTFLNTLMGNLPESRVAPSKPFHHAGVDYAGPFYIKSSTLRNHKVIKSFLCIFVCMSSKAVHLEVVSGLSIDVFLNALKRFFSRRGKSQHLFSDNGSNFVGANNELKCLTDYLQKHHNELYDSLSQDGITWHFIPPRASHFGGLWESCVKTAKYHLKRVIGNVHLTFEELSTVTAQVEACMNSRPICPLSDDPLDLNPLTPGHILTGGPLVALPQGDLMNTAMNRLTRFQHLTQMVQHFWSRWSSEYLPALNPRSKWWRDNTHMLKPGIMVLLKNENLPPLKWPLGRIIDLHPGHDGVVRVVTVRTSSGITKRAINKLAVLPIDY